MLDQKETIKVVADCRNDKCGRVAVLTVELEKLERWMKGENISDVFPDLTANEREVIIQGCRGNYYLCESCWDLLMVEEEE